LTLLSKLFFQTKLEFQASYICKRYKSSIIFIIKTILAQKHIYLKCTCIASASIVAYGVCALKTENIFAMIDIFIKDCFQIT